MSVIISMSLCRKLPPHQSRTVLRVVNYWKHLLGPGFVAINLNFMMSYRQSAGINYICDTGANTLMVEVINKLKSIFIKKSSYQGIGGVKMNRWTQLSIEFANQRNYLDELFKVYPTIPEGMGI